MEQRRIDFDSLAWHEPLPRARHKIVQYGRQRLRLLELGKGFAEPGWCARGHVGYVLNGDLDVQFDNETVRFSAGNGMFIPAGEEHRHKATVVSETATLILVETE